MEVQVEILPIEEVKEGMVISSHAESEQFKVDVIVVFASIVWIASQNFLFVGPKGQNVPSRVTS